MDKRNLLKRKIFLKRQALKIIHTKRKEMKQRLSLIRIRDALLKQMGSEFNPILSQKIDCIDFLLRE